MLAISLLSFRMLDENIGPELRLDALPDTIYDGVIVFLEGQNKKYTLPQRTECKWRKEVFGSKLIRNQMSLLRRVRGRRGPALDLARDKEEPLRWPKRVTHQHYRDRSNVVSPTHEHIH